MDVYFTHDPGTETLSNIAKTLFSECSFKVISYLQHIFENQNTIIYN